MVVEGGMTHFRKKPVIVSAKQYVGIPVGDVSKAVEFDDWLCEHQNPDNPCRYVGHTLIIPGERPAKANPTDWIVSEPFVGLFVVTDDVFRATYEIAEEPDFEDMEPDGRSVADQAKDLLKSV